MSNNSKRQEQTPLTKPPEGVTSGDTIPVENQEDEMERQMIDDAVAVLKTREEYHGKSNSELREIAKEKLL